MQQNQELVIIAPTKEFPKRQFIATVQLGSGAQGSVYLARSENWGSNSNMEVALKFSYRNAVQQKEIEFLKTLKDYQSSEKEIYSPCNIIRVFDFFEYDHQGQLYYVTIMEKGQNDLFNYLSQKRITLTEIEKLIICRDITKPILFLHSLQSIHRDVKAENFIQVGEKFKLIDFGSIKQRVSGQRMTMGVGTPLFQAPEIVDGSIDYTEKIDVWALSCLYYEIFNDRALFDCQTRDAVKQKIINHKVNQKETFDKIDQLNCNPQFKQLMKQMLEPDPEKRIDSFSVINQLQKLILKNENPKIETQQKLLPKNDTQEKSQNNNNQEIHQQNINAKFLQIQNELKKEIEEKFQTLQLKNQGLFSLQEEKYIQIIEESINKNMKESTLQVQKFLEEILNKNLEQYTKKLQKQFEDYVIKNIEGQAKIVENRFAIIIQDQVKAHLEAEMEKNQQQIKMQEIQLAVNEAKKEILALQKYNNQQAIPQFEQLFEIKFDLQDQMIKQINKELSKRLNEQNSIAPQLQNQLRQFQNNSFIQFNNQFQFSPAQKLQLCPPNQNPITAQRTFSNSQDDRILTLEKACNDLKQQIYKLEQFSEKQKDLFKNISELKL